MMSHGPGLSFLTPDRQKIYRAKVVKVLNPPDPLERHEERNNRIPMIVDTCAGPSILKNFAILELEKLQLVDHRRPTVKDLQSFESQFKLLKKEEWGKTLGVSKEEFEKEVQNMVPCVACRSGSIRLFDRVQKQKFTPYGPFVQSQSGYTIGPESLTCEFLWKLFHNRSSNLTGIMKSVTTGTSGKRCPTHSVDMAQRSQRNLTVAQVLDIWNDINKESQASLAVLSPCQLLKSVTDSLEDHSFCECCSFNVLTALRMLLRKMKKKDLPVHLKKQYSKSIYNGMVVDKDGITLTLDPTPEFINNLIKRAAPAHAGERIIRHARTLQIAQEEVVICVGIQLIERLHYFQLKFREEVKHYDVIIGVFAQLFKNKFEMAVESKLGVSQLELFCDEFSQEQVTNEKKKLAKQEKKKRQKQRKLQAATEEILHSTESLCETTSQEIIDTSASAYLSQEMIEPSPLSPLASISVVMAYVPQDRSVVSSVVAQKESQQISQEMDKRSPLTDAESPKVEIEDVNTNGINAETRHRLNFDFNHPDHCDFCWDSSDNANGFSPDVGYSSNNVAELRKAGCSETKNGRKAAAAKGPLLVKSMMELLAEADANDGEILTFPVVKSYSEPENKQSHDWMDYEEELVVYMRKWGLSGNDEGLLKIENESQVIDTPTQNGHNETSGKDCVVRRAKGAGKVSRRYKGRNRR